MTTTIELIRVVLESREPGAVTEPWFGGQNEPDRVPLHDHKGKSALPATSVAGNLRAHIASSSGEEFATRIMGYVEGNNAQASSLQVVGTKLIAGGETLDERSTAIDRRRAAARTSTLRYTKTLDKGSVFGVFLRWDDPAEEDLAQFTKLLASWRPLLGSGVSAGRGAMTVLSIHHGRLDLTDAADLRTFLTTSGPGLFKEVAPATDEHQIVPQARAVDQLTFTMRLVDALHIGSGTTKPENGHEVAQVVKSDGMPLVPARALRGVIRSRVEFILRSLEIGACCDQKCGTCLACDIFGHGGGESDTDSVGKRSRVRFLDAPIESAVLAQRTHAPIDRFTGGSAKSVQAGEGQRLFTQEVVDAGTFTITVEPLGITPAEPAVWEDAKALITLAIHDMHLGYVGLGGGTTRGQGTVSWCEIAESESVDAEQKISEAAKEAKQLLASARVRLREINDSPRSKPEDKEAA